jgi:hypothetical protein
MRIPRRCLNLRMSKQVSYHCQPFADEQSAGCECMAEIVNAYIVQSRGLTYAAPWMLEVCEVFLILLTHDYERITSDELGSTA